MSNPENQQQATELTDDDRLRCESDPKAIAWAREVVAVADGELAELRAEVERLRESNRYLNRRVNRADMATDRAQEHVKVLQAALAEKPYQSDLDDALAERERAEAKLRAVEALADEWETRARRNDPQDGPAMLGALFAARSLRAVLDSHPTGTPDPNPNTGEAQR